MASFSEESFQVAVIICDNNWLKGSKWEVMTEPFGMKGQKVETEMAGNTTGELGQSAECTLERFQDVPVSVQTGCRARFSTGLPK